MQAFLFPEIAARRRRMQRAVAFRTIRPPLWRINVEKEERILYHHFGNNLPPVAEWEIDKVCADLTVKACAQRKAEEGVAICIQKWKHEYGLLGYPSWKDLRMETVLPTTERKEVIGAKIAAMHFLDRLENEFSITKIIEMARFDRLPYVVFSFYRFTDTLPRDLIADQIVAENQSDPANTVKLVMKHWLSKRYNDLVDYSYPPPIGILLNMELRKRRPPDMYCPGIQYIRDYIELPESSFRYPYQ